MMSLIDLDDEQRWVPTHVNVTVLRARDLRTKGKHGSRYLYTVVQVGKDKHTTGLVERAAVPEWNEECCFELLPGILEEEVCRSAYPPGSGDLVFTVMHRVLIGLDVFLGQVSIPLERIFHDGPCPRDEWMKLNSKAGRKEKERGELQVTVQFTRNNMTASMFDLTIKDKPRSAFGKLKDRVTGRKRGDMESTSAILPGRYAALSGNLGQPNGECGGVELLGEEEVVEDKRSKVKDFFKGKLRRSSDTRSCSSLASESSVSSLASDNLGPPPSLDLLADPPSSPIYTSKVRVDTHYGEADLAKQVLTSQHTTKVLTHKRAFSDEASKITATNPTSAARTSPAVEALKGRTMTQSKSSLCINGSHIYDSEPSSPRNSAALPSKLVLLEKCSPLSRSLQNLTKRSSDSSATSPGESRRWSVDKVKKEEREEEKESEPAAQGIQSGRTPVSSAAAVSPDKGKKQKKTLFSGGKSESGQGQAGPAVEGRLRGWFGSTDAQNKPRLEVSPKVESSTDVPTPLPPCSPIPQQFQFPSSSPSTSPTDLVSPYNGSHSSPFSASSFPPSTPISTSNPFLTHMQRNPFFEELIAEELRKSPPLAPRSPSVSASSPSLPCNPNPAHDAKPKKTTSARRERPRPVARQISLPAMLPKSAMPCSPDHSAPHSMSETNPAPRSMSETNSAPRSMSETKEECDDFFDAFASSRLNSPKGPLPQKVFKATLSQPHRSSNVLNSDPFHTIDEQKAGDIRPPPVPPRRLLRTPVNEVYTDTWLHRGQRLAVQHEACLLSRTGAASLQHGRDAERKRNTSSVSPDHLTASETSESLSVRSPMYENVTSPAFKSEESLKKFKYEPLEDEADRWRGMLFEQDLYGRVGMGNCSEAKVNTALGSGVSPKEANLLEGNDWTENKVCLDEKMIVSDLLGSLTTTLTQKSNMMDIGDSSSILQPTVHASPVHQGIQPLCTNNNMSHSLTLEDLNMNVNDSDFTFIDSGGSSPSETGDTVNNLKSLDTVFPQPSEDILLANYHVEMSVPDHALSLNQTNTTQNNISLEATSTLSNELLLMFPVGEEEGCEFRNTTLQSICEVGSFESRASAQAAVESQQDTPEDALMKTLDEDLDGNGNLKASRATPNKKDSSSLSAVVSARLRPNGLRGPANQCTQGEASEQQLPREPSESHHTGVPLVTEDMSYFSEIPLESWTSSKADPNAMTTTHTQPCTNGETRSSFEELHAEVVPDKRSISNSQIRQSSPEGKPSPSFSCSAVSTSPGPPNPPPGASCLSVQPVRTFPSPRSNSTLAVAPFTASSSSSFSSPPIDAPHTLLPEEIEPACNLPRQESSPHPVKPLNSTASQSDKKEGRSVLEKLKSTIHPGRTASQGACGPERSQAASVDNSAQYQQLSNMELIALLLQQEMDMQKQQAASEQQGALLDKREAELKKLKAQVRDLEDYIDNLLLRIMEQTPTLLQVRARHK